MLAVTGVTMLILKRTRIEASLLSWCKKEKTFNGVWTLGALGRTRKFRHLGQEEVQEASGIPAGMRSIFPVPHGQRSADCQLTFDLVFFFDSHSMSSRISRNVLQVFTSLFSALKSKKKNLAPDLVGGVPG